MFLNKNSAALNIIESFFLHQTEVHIKAMCDAKLWSEQIYIFRQ